MWPLFLDTLILDLQFSFLFNLQLCSFFLIDLPLSVYYQKSKLDLQMEGLSLFFLFFFPSPHLVNSSANGSVYNFLEEKEWERESRSESENWVARKFLTIEEANWGDKGMRWRNKKQGEWDLCPSHVYFGCCGNFTNDDVSRRPNNLHFQNVS